METKTVDDYFDEDAFKEDWDWINGPEKTEEEVEEQVDAVYMRFLSLLAEEDPNHPWLKGVNRTRPLKQPSKSHAPSA